MQIVKCVVVSLMLLVQTLIFSFFLVASWFSGRGILRIVSAIVTAIGFTVCMVIGIRLLS